jgi:hypothetical protein
MLAVPFSGSLRAQELKSDPLAFETCSRQTNELTELVEVLDRYRVAADQYNERHDMLRGQLDQMEKSVQSLDAQIKESPGNRKLWKTYDTAYANYEVAMDRMREWNEHGDRFGEDYQSSIDDFHTLRAQIANQCDGAWELGIIRKYCDDTRPGYQEFCKQFEG